MVSNRYTLYVGNNCCSCKNVKHYINKNKLKISIVNIEDKEYHLPFSLMIIPALVKSEKIIAYGADIIKHLKRKENLA